MKKNGLEKKNEGSPMTIQWYELKKINVTKKKFFF